MHQFNSVLDENKIPDCMYVFSEPTTEPNGLEISFAVRSEDFEKFAHEAHSVLSYFEVLPKLTNKSLHRNHDSNTRCPVTGTWDSNHRKPENFLTETVLVMKNRRIRLTNQSADWWMNFGSVFGKNREVIMGGVSYDLDMNELKNQSGKVDMLLDQTFSIVVPIGAVEPQASREGLSYTKNTKKFLIAFLDRIVDEIQAAFSDLLKDAETYIDGAEILLGDDIKKNLLSEIASLNDYHIFNKIKNRTTWGSKKLCLMDWPQGEHMVFDYKTPRLRNSLIFNGAPPSKTQFVLAEDVDHSKRFRQKFQKYMEINKISQIICATKETLDTWESKGLGIPFGHIIDVLNFPKNATVRAASTRTPKQKSDVWKISYMVGSSSFGSWKSELLDITVVTGVEKIWIPANGKANKFKDCYGAFTSPFKFLFIDQMMENKLEDKAIYGLTGSQEALIKQNSDWISLNDFDLRVANKFVDKFGNLLLARKIDGALRQFRNEFCCNLSDGIATLFDSYLTKYPEDELPSLLRALFCKAPEDMEFFSRRAMEFPSPAAKEAKAFDLWDEKINRNRIQWSSPPLKQLELSCTEAYERIQHLCRADRIGRGGTALEIEVLKILEKDPDLKLFFKSAAASHVQAILQKRVDVKPVYSPATLEVVYVDNTPKTGPHYTCEVDNQPEEATVEASPEDQDIVECDGN
jgi:hypothetical protein